MLGPQKTLGLLAAEIKNAPMRSLATPLVEYFNSIACPTKEDCGMVAMIPIRVSAIEESCNGGAWGDIRIALK